MLLKYQQTIILIITLITVWTIQAGAGSSPATIGQIPLPAGYTRVPVKKGSYGAWLRSVPLKPMGSPVLLFNGSRKSNQDIHFAVLDISTGRKNLQQCADAIMRLRAEYFFSRKEYKKIRFKLTSGHPISFSRWAKGHRVRIRGRKVSWTRRRHKKSYSHKNLLEYLELIYTYAGTASLSRDMKKISSIKKLQIGDVFIQGGYPGHAVVVVDMAVHKKSRIKIFLLAQSYMPAQDMHILLNPAAPATPWYSTRFGTTLKTPEWDFKKKHLKKFR
ncbi:MAG: DUF4846 domain-containing protein [bacterium]|nr:DUF4846 domain-containing protein [bacterium]